MCLNVFPANWLKVTEWRIKIIEWQTKKRTKKEMREEQVDIVAVAAVITVVTISSET